MTNLAVTDTALLVPTVHAVLERLHTLADTNDTAIIQQVLGSGYDWKSASAEQNSAMFRDALLPISRDNGRFLYGVARSISARHIVEFGTSYGVSTIYFAAALRDNGGGLVVSSELESRKVAHAAQNLAEAGLAELVEMHYLLTTPVIMDDTALHELFGDIRKTSYDEGVHRTLEVMSAKSLR